MVYVKFFGAKKNRNNYILYIIATFPDILLLLLYNDFDITTKILVKYFINYFLYYIYCLLYWFLYVY